MYEIIKNVINSGRYELSDMLKKIDVIWLQTDVTDEQRAELIELAREKAVPENSYASVQKQIDTLFLNLAELAVVVKGNTDAITVLQGGTVEPPVEEEWPEYVRPTGAHDTYNTGNKVTYKNKHYICQMDNCAWNPEDYPDAWIQEE